MLIRTGFLRSQPLAHKPFLHLYSIQKFQFELTTARMASTLNHTSQKFKLNTGDEIPAIGLGRPARPAPRDPTDGKTGTWQSAPGAVRAAVKAALLAGYRHIDTALAYGNEREVGQGIKDSGVPREQIWITTKLDNPWHKRVEDGLRTSCESLGVEYVDLYLMVSFGRRRRMGG
jgi:glycerol 2-dehydrogenase (NADP+)